MAYQVLARKWRPQDFTGVIGQEPIVTALRNALTDGRIAQAYLFSGIRGVGKTSVARILAKALNCERGPAADPCNECATCREITAGSDFDVLEVDAATYSKVEQVRELTESLKYQPARDRYKVVIVDEIHRLSRQAFDALLKIVEEPPAYLIFIFATTESEAVPATILSRCQEYRFRRVPAEILARHLGDLAAREEIEVSEAALGLLARAGDGSVRDAVALLDQLATFGSGTISDQEAARVLGGVDHDLFHRLLAAILEGRPAGVSEIVAAVEAEGWDPRHVYGEFLAYCRDALHLALGGGATGLPGEAAAALAQLVGGARYENLLRLLHQLLESEAAVRRSEASSLALEIAWLRAAELPKLVRVEEVLAGGGPVAPPGSGSGGDGRGGTTPDDTGPGTRARSEAATGSPAGAGGRREARAADAGAERDPGLATGASGPAPSGGPGKDAPAAEEAAEEIATGPEAAGGAAVAAPAADTEAADTGAATTGAATTAPRAEPSEAEGPSAGGDRGSPHGGAEAPAREAADRDADREGARDDASPPPPEPPPALDSAGDPPADEGAPRPAGTEPATPAGGVRRFLERVSVRKQLLAAHLGESQQIVWADGTLEIHSEEGDDWLTAERLDRESNRRVIERALNEVWGEKATWKLVSSPARPAPQTPEPEQQEPSAAASHPRVQAVLDIFDGKVESVRHDQNAGD